MKKLILVFAAIAITAGAYAQNDSTDRKISSPDIDNIHDDMNQDWDVHNDQDHDMLNNPVPDGVIMKNGKIMKVKNGQMTVLDNDMNLSNGTKIRSDGTWIKEDGTKMTMEEGQHIDMSGKMIYIKTKKDKNMYLVPDSLKNKDY